ncbi:Nebulin [Manis pentadactyla]|nr:Nebulin [Manis pentadactyla]
MQKVGTTLGIWEAGEYYLCPAADLGSKSDLGVQALEGHAPVFHDGCARVIQRGERRGSPRWKGCALVDSYLLDHDSFGCSLPWPPGHSWRRRPVFTAPESVLPDRDDAGEKWGKGEAGTMRLEVSGGAPALSVSGGPAEPEYAPAGRSRSPGGAPEPGDAPRFSAVLRPPSQKAPLGGVRDVPVPSVSSHPSSAPRLRVAPSAGRQGRGPPGRVLDPRAVGPRGNRDRSRKCQRPGGRPGRIRSLVAGERVPGRGHSANKGPERRGLLAAWEPRKLTLAETCAPRPRLWSGAPALPGPPGPAAPALRSLRAAAPSVLRSRQNASLSLSASSLGPPPPG